MKVEIKKKSENKVLAEACLIAKDPCIVENDVLLMKILLLKSDEDKFLKTANLSDPSHVLRAGEGWICNVCRNEFRDEAEAESHRHNGNIHVSRIGYLRELREILPELR